MGFRKKADYFGLYSDPNEIVDTIDEIWDILNANPNHVPTSNRRTLSEINFPTNYANGEKLSAFDRKMSSDYVHFRVGPARLFQFRNNCSNFKNSWDEGSFFRSYSNFNECKGLLSQWIIRTLAPI